MAVSCPVWICRERPNLPKQLNASSPVSNTTTYVRCPLLSCKSLCCMAHKSDRRSPCTNPATGDWFPPPPRSARGPAQHRHQLGDLAPLLGGAATDDGVFDAVSDVIAQHLLLDPPERGAHRGNLGDDVDAIAIILEHAGEPAHLPLDAAEALLAGGFGWLAHA